MPSRGRDRCSGPRVRTASRFAAYDSTTLSTSRMTTYDTATDPMNRNSAVCTGMLPSSVSRSAGAKRTSATKSTGLYGEIVARPESETSGAPEDAAGGRWVVALIRPPHRGSAWPSSG